jgi:hypothetical protein
MYQKQKTTGTCTRAHAVAPPFGYKISDSDIGDFEILQQLSGFADRIFRYFAIFQQMSGFADQVFGYFAILLQVQVPSTSTGTLSVPQIRIFVDNDFISVQARLSRPILGPMDHFFFKQSDDGKPLKNPQLRKGSLI